LVDSKLIDVCFATIDSYVYHLVFLIFNFKENQFQIKIREIKYDCENKSFGNLIFEMSIPIGAYKLIQLENSVLILTEVEIVNLDLTD